MTQKIRLGKPHPEASMKSRTPTVLAKAALSLFGENTSAESPESVENFVRRRAYELFESRGRQPGRDVEDWLDAEREVKRHLGIPS